MKVVHAYRCHTLASRTDYQCDGYIACSYTAQDLYMTPFHPSKLRLCVHSLLNAVHGTLVRGTAAHPVNPGDCLGTDLVHTTPARVRDKVEDPGHHELSC